MTCTSQLSSEKKKSREDLEGDKEVCANDDDLTENITESDIVENDRVVEWDLAGNWYKKELKLRSFKQ